MFLGHAGLSGLGSCVTSSAAHNTLTRPGARGTQHAPLHPPLNEIFPYHVPATNATPGPQIPTQWVGRLTEGGR